MIESRYWKEELRRIAWSARPVSAPKRWSERTHCVLERDIMVGFFMLRRLIELHKVSAAIRNFGMQVYFAPNRGKQVNRLNSGDLDSLYDFAREKKQTKKPMYMSNQFIHAYMSFIARDQCRNWDSMFVVSDFDRNQCIWRVPVPLIRTLFDLASRDLPPSSIYPYVQCRPGRLRVFRQLRAAVQGSRGGAGRFRSLKARPPIATVEKLLPRGNGNNRTTASS
jgi:hypothetical protein